MNEADSGKSFGKMDNISTGIRDENAGVGGSNPSPRTILQGLEATMTPPWLAADMVALANVKPNDLVLEPSAGTGVIIDALNGHHPVMAIELNKANFSILKSLPSYAQCHNVDFLRYDFWGVKFDRVIMNPPRRRCAEHIKKASSLLRKDGRLVALVHTDYVEEIEKFLPNVRKYLLPVETFHINNITVKATILVWDKG